MRRIDLIPYACGAGARTSGSAQGPIVLQKLKLENALTTEGYEAGWTDFYRSAQNQADIVSGSEQAAQIVYDHVVQLHDDMVKSFAKGNMPICIGGDHSLAMGSLSAAATAHDAHGKIGLLWIDAHTDIHTPETSPRNTMHGMPIAHLLGLGNEKFTSIGSAKPKLSPEHICMIGIRDFEPEEKQRIDALGIRVFSARDVHEQGMARIMEQAMDIITQGTKIQYLSFDIDGLDPEYAPAVGTPVEQGLSEDEFAQMVDILSENISFAGIDIAEYDPTLDKQGQTASLIYRLLPKMVAQEKKISTTILKRAVF